MSPRMVGQRSSLWLAGTAAGPNGRRVTEHTRLRSVLQAARLSNVGYRLQIRNALGGGYGPDCFRQLRHEFLVVAGEGDMVGADLIVEVSSSGPLRETWRECRAAVQGKQDSFSTHDTLWRVTFPIVHKSLARWRCFLYF